MSIKIPDDHPRANSLRTREHLIEFCKKNVVAYAGLVAHGRGEAFDYLLGEATAPCALEALKAGAAKFLLARHPVISVNGNTAALCPEKMVELAEVTGAKLEVNLFYRTSEREQAIKEVLTQAGAKEILGVDPEKMTVIPELQSERRKVDKEGIFKGDVIFVPLEDGDRTEALVKGGKFVITCDLNPLSRTARMSQITIVDEFIRTMDHLIRFARELKGSDRLEQIVMDFDNNKNLGASLEFISSRLISLGKELSGGKKD